jgi:carboxylesterase
VIFPVIIGAAALIGVVGRARSRRIARQLDSRFERDADGVIVGAGPIALEGDSDAAILLVHGGGDTPQTMRNLADELHRRGYSVVAPLLPGHGRDLAAFDRSSADAWYAEVERQYGALRASHPWVGVVGLSMGGALSARLAAEKKNVDALVLCSPYLGMTAPAALLARTAVAWGALVPVVATGSERSVLDPRARATSLGYGAFTRHSLRGLLETARRGFASLPAITTPTLVIQSTTDNRISTAATQAAFERIGAADKEIEWIEGSGHVITVDFGWERVARRAADWMDRHRAETKTGRREGAPAS